MMSEKDYIEKCMHEIEDKFNLNAGGMMERDYEYLHDKILEETRTDLSTSTLRRLWSGKYQGIPQIKTLDALAQLLGCSGWHSYKQNVSHKKRSNKSVILQRSLFVIVLAGLVLVGSLFISSEEAVGEVVLSPEVETYEGVPATIGFHYSVKSPGVEIELSWNPYERAQLDPNNDFYTGTYYYPDFHQAKLLKEDRVLVQKSVHITTKGWHGLIMDSGMDTRPQYLDSTDFIRAGKLIVDSNTIEKVTPEATEIYPVLTLSNGQLEKISGDDFSLESFVRLHKMENAPLCRYYEVLIKGTEGNMRIPVAQEGCYGIMGVHCAEKKLSGKFTDLSDLTTDLLSEHQLRITSENKRLTISVAENQAFELDFEKEIGKLKVIKFIFNGPAEVSDFKLKNGEGVPLISKVLHPF